MTYTVSRSEVSGGPYTPIATGLVGTNYVDPDRTPGVEYFYVVSSDNICGSSAYSPEASAVCPTTPAWLIATGHNQGYIDLTWSAPGQGGVIGYAVKRQHLDTDAYYLLAIVTETNFRDYLVSWETQYYYAVTALYADGGESGPSNIASAMYHERDVFDMERGTVFQGVQIGPETTPGVAVAATARLLAMQAEPVPNVPLKTYRPQGSKAFTATQTAKEQTDAKFSGIMDFNLLAYIYSSVLGAPNSITSLGGGAYRWYWEVDPIQASSPQTFTFEVGSSSFAASKFTYGTVTDCNFSTSKEEASIDGTIIGQLLTDNITMTTGVPELPTVAVAPKNIRVSVGPAANSLTKLKKIISSTMRTNGRWKPAFFQDDAQASFTGLVEVAPDFGMNIVTEMGSDADTFLTALRNDTMQYAQILVTGPKIADGTGTPTIADPVAAGTVVQATTTGTIVPGKYYVSFTWIMVGGETASSPALLVTVPAGTSTNKITLTAPIALPVGATGTNAYLGTSPSGMQYAGTSATNAVVIAAYPALGAAVAPTVNTTPVTGGFATIYHSLKKTMPIKFQRITREDHDGVYGATYDGVVAHDATFGLVQIELVNKLASL